jgi:hypothetical protein
MPDDWGAFAIGIVIFVLYLVWSAATEMGTRGPGRDRSDESNLNREPPERLT